MAAEPVLFRSLHAAAASAPRAFETLPERVDVAVVGGGVVGLSVAWALRARGVDAALFDAGATGSGTSSAATGMLAAAAEHEPGGEALLALALESQRLWPAFRDAVEAAGRLSVDYRPDGTLVVAVGRDETERLRARHDRQRRAGLSTRWLTGPEARGREAGLTPAVTGAILCPDDHQVNPPRLLAALRAAVLASGGRLCEGAPVEALDWTGGRVTGVRVGGRLVHAATTVLASGAGLGGTALLPAPLRPPVRPLKGQSLGLRPRGGPPPLSHVLWTADIHLAPKSDGRLILGATIEEAGFDTALTAGGLLALLDAARRVLPGVEEMAVEDMWAGFRPTSEDDAPLLGALAPGLALAAGHHRNGYLLAPVTARAIADLVTTGRIEGAAAGFGPGRFAPARTGAP